MKCKNRRDRPRSLRPRSLSPARKNTLGKSARSVKRGGAARLGAAECSANDRRPFKSRRLKSFSTRGSGKHRHGFSSTFQTPAAAAAAAAAATRAHRPGASFSFSRALSPARASARNVRASGNPAEFIRSLLATLPLFSAALPGVPYPPNNLFDSLRQNSRSNKETSCRSEHGVAARQETSSLRDSPRSIAPISLRFIRLGVAKVCRCRGGRSLRVLEKLSNVSFSMNYRCGSHVHNVHRASLARR